MRALGFNTRLSVACLCGFLVIGAARVAAADTLTLMWDPNPDTNVAGYMVYVGTESGVYTNSYDVGNTTSFPFNAAPGQRYYFAVAAYAYGPLIGNRSGEVSASSDMAPSLVNPGNQFSVVGQPATLQLVGSDPQNQPVSYGATSLPPGLVLTAATGFISGSPTVAGTFMVTASVTDGVLSDAKTFSWTVGQAGTSAPSSGTTSPSLNNGKLPEPSGPSTPNTSQNLPPTLTDPGPQTATRGARVVLQLRASDPEGSALTFGASGLPAGLQISSRGEITGTPTSAGNFVVTATVTDGALSDAKTFGWSVLQPVGDTTSPILTITVPTSSINYTTSDAFVTLGGSASDDGRIVSVQWLSDRGASGNATGTDNWIASVPLVGGTNTITVSARDEAGNVSSRSIVVKTKFSGGNNTSSGGGSTGSGGTGGTGGNGRTRSNTN